MATAPKSWKRPCLPAGSSPCVSQLPPLALQWPELSPRGLCWAYRVLTAEAPTAAQWDHALPLEKDEPLRGGRAGTSGQALLEQSCRQLLLSSLTLHVGEEFKH